MPKSKRKNIWRINGNGTNKQLAADIEVLQRESLMAQRSLTQSLRKNPQTSGGGSTLSPATVKLLAVDREVDRKLRRLVAQYGWPTVGLAGIQASNDALGLLMSLHDTQLNEELLPRLERLAAHRKIARPNVAVIIDEVLVAQGRPQRYGTILSVQNGKLVSPRVEDPAHLEQRRRAFGLEENLKAHLTAELRAAEKPCRANAVRPLRPQPTALPKRVASSRPPSSSPTRNSRAPSA